MLLRKAHVYRLYPTPAQAEAMGAWVGAVRFTYNLALEQRRVFGRRGRSITYNTQAKDLTALRAEVDWLRDAPSSVLQQGLRDLDRAYRDWWAGRTGAPTPRKRGVNDAMRFPDPNAFAFRRISRRIGEVKLPKLGWVRMLWDRAIRGDVKNITVVRRAGVWTAAAQYEREMADPEPSALPAVGVDRGVTVFAALSDGAKIAPANHGKAALRSLSRAQRKLARKVRGSNNRRKQVRRVARIQARVAAARKDFLHKHSTAIAKNHGAVVLEKLEVRSMVSSARGTADKPGRNVRAKAGLNRSILDQGWGMFRTMLAYKLTERGGLLVEVSPRNTSRECAECGAVDAGSRQGQRFRCVACGHEAHADTNAAKNILQRARGTRLLPVEATDCRADEAGTDRRAA